MVLPPQFYRRPTIDVAKDLLGTFLMHDSPEGRTVGRIVETEAYLFFDDPACHAARGQSKRNAAMFGPAGRCYIYLIYGIHYCFNVVTGQKGHGEAVLIRALEPVEGASLMAGRRNTAIATNLCSGPGKLVQALGISGEQNDSCLRRGPIQIHSTSSRYNRLVSSEVREVVETTRIGINKGKELPLRYYVKDSPFISKR